MPAPAIDDRRRQLLSEALQLSRWLLGSDRSDPLVQRRQARLHHLQQELQQYAHPIQRDRLPVAELPLPVRLAFVESLVLVTRYRQVGGEDWRGTLPSFTLSHYQTDDIPPHWNGEAAIARWVELFDLPAETEQRLHDRLASIDRQQQEQQQIIGAALASVGLDREQAIAPSAVLDLFQQVFGPVPIPVAAIQGLYTSAQIFFCIDYEGDRLCDPHWQALSRDKQQQVAQFLQQISQFSFEKFDRFPIFGAAEPQRIHLPWCDRLAQQLGRSSGRILEVLLRSVSIIPTRKAEAFLVHDIWGHYWQLRLTSFESDYVQLATCDEPLRAGETAYTDEGPITCRELFWVEDGTVRLDEERSRLFFHSEVQQRLGLVFTHLLGEMVADVAEFKFIWDHPDLGDRLPSSSVFKTLPAKLDLGLADIDFLFLRVLHPLLTLQLSVTTPSPLEEELLADWGNDGGALSLELHISLKQAIARLYQIFFEEYNRTYLPTLTGNVGIFTQAVSNLLYLQNALNQLYTDAIAQDATLPFQDVLMIFVAVYCSSNSYAEFWEVDDAIAGYFLPCWAIATSNMTYTDAL